MTGFLILYRGPILGPMALFLRGLAGAWWLQSVSGLFLTVQLGTQGFDLGVLNPYAVAVSMIGNVTSMVAAQWLFVMFLRQRR